MADNPIAEAMRAARGGADNPVAAAMRSTGGGGEPEGPPSLWGQMQGVVGSIIPGLAHMGADVAQDAYALTQLPSAVSLGIAANMPGQAGADLVQGIHRNRFIRPFVGEEMVTDAAQGAGFSDNMRRAFPFMGSMGTSMRQTGERVVNQGAALAPGGLAAGDSQYAQASREGAILPVLLEDVGNAAIVTSLASRGASRVAAGAAEQSRAAEAVARAARPLETGGATAASSEVTPAFTGSRWMRPMRTLRQLSRVERELTGPAPDMVSSAAGGPGARVFEVGGAGPAATVQVVDDATAAASRAAADRAAASALRWERAARGLHQAARLGDSLADAPARVFTWPAQQAVTKLAPIIGETRAGQFVGQAARDTFGGLARRAAERRAGRQTIHQAELEFTEGAGEIRLASIAADRLFDTPEEGVAGLLGVSGVADAIWPVITSIQDDLAAQFGVSPEQARAWAVESAQLGENVTPETLELAYRYSQTREWVRSALAAEEAGAPEPPRPTGMLTPEEFQRIDGAQEILREEVRGPRGSRYFRAWGESRGVRPDEQTAATTTQAVNEAGMVEGESAESAARDAAARAQQDAVRAGRVEQRGAEPLSVVVNAARDKFQPKIDAAVRRVIEAQETATKADARRILDPDAFQASIIEQVRQTYADARQVAQAIVETDPMLARAVAAPDPRITVSDEALVDLVAGRLVSARGSRNPQLRQLMSDLKDAGYEVPFDLPNPSTLAPAEARARVEERARIYGSQARAARAQADNATAQREAWEQQPQRVAYAPEGATSRLEARSRAFDTATRMQAEGPNPLDADVAARDARRAANAAAFGVEVRPGEPFRVPREKITGDQADPTPLQNTTDADGNYREGMLADIAMRGGELHPAVDAITEVTPGRFMEGERVWIAYDGEGRAVGYLATYGDGYGLSIAVDPAARGQGIGLKLYGAAEAAGVDLPRALADEEFTAAGAALYERFVNGPEEGLAVTHERPVQRRVFESAAEKERRAQARYEAEQRAARAGQQQTVEVPEPQLPEPVELPENGLLVQDGPQPRQPGASKVLFIDDLESGRASDSIPDGEYVYNRITGEMVELPWGDSPDPLTIGVRPDGVDENGFSNYFDAMTEQQREEFYRTYRELPFDTEAQNIADQLAESARPEPLYSVRVGPGTAIQFDSRQLGETAEFEGGPNPYAKISELPPKGGVVHLTRAELDELYNQADADADPHGPYSDSADIGHRNAANTLKAQIEKVRAGDPDSVQRQAAADLLTPAQYRAVSGLMDYEGGIDGWPMDAVAEGALTAEEMYRRIDQRIEELDGIKRNKAEGAELRALRASLERLERRWPRGEGEVTQGDIDRLAFNATIARHFMDDVEKIARVETPPEGLLETGPARGDVIETTAREKPEPAGELPPVDPTDPELNQRLDAHLAEFEQAGTRAKYELEGEWQGAFGEADYLEHLPRQFFKAQDAQQVPTEWEWFVALPPWLQRMIRERYMAPDPAADARRVAKGFPRDPRVGTGSSPDEVAQFFRSRLDGGTNANFDVGVEEAMAEYVRLIVERDALERVTNPRARATDAEIEMAAERMGMDPDVLKALRSSEGGRSRQAMLERLAQVVAREQVADSMGPPPPTIRPGQVPPWEMSVEDYAAELTEMESRLAAWAEQQPPVDPSGDVFDDVIEPSEVAEARERLSELAPLELDDADTPAAPDVLHQRLIDAAERHGVARTADDIRADIREWSATWSQYAVELQRVREQMQALIVSSDELRSTPLNALEQTARGLPADHPIRRYVDLQAEERRLLERESYLTDENVRLNNALRAVEGRSQVPDEVAARIRQVEQAAARAQETIARIEEGHPELAAMDTEQLYDYAQANPMGPYSVHEQLRAARSELWEAQQERQRLEAAAQPAPDRIFDPVARGQEAVADAETRALEAFIEDAENRRVARMSGQRVLKEDLLYNELNEPARRIYRQMVRDAKVVTEEARLELARRQLGQKLIAQGRRAQAPISRQEGRLVARERIMQSGAEVAERRVERALDTLESGPSKYEARTTALERSLNRFGRGQRKIGLREGEARAREVDLGSAERTLIRLLDRQADAERKARMSSAAAPARFAAELRAANNLRAAIEAEADWLDEVSEPGAGDLLRSLTFGIPESVYDAVRAGGAAADPEHLIGGTWGADKIGSALGRLDESLPYVRRTGQERVASRVAGGTQFDVRAQAIEEIKRYKDSVRNELARQMQERFGVRPHDLGVTLRGRELVEAMKERGFVPWDPANPLDRPPATQVTGQTTFLPESLYTAFKRSTFGEKPRWEQNLELWYDRRFLGTLKTAWLALSPRWQIGNLVGNSLMAVIGGGVDPITLVQHMREARVMLAEDPKGELLLRQQQLNDKYGGIPRELLNRGMTHEEMTYLNPDLENTTRNPIARLARRSYGLNEFTDNVFRSAVYLSKAEPRVELWNDLNAGRISPEQFMARVGNTLSTRQALDGALHAAGDFQNLTPWERNVIKRLWIFYPWYRHITKLALSLPLNHPTRVIWTLHLAQLWGDEEEQSNLPPFLRGSIPLGDDRYLRTGALNPFGQVEDSPLLSPGSALGGITPAITWPAAILMGVDLTRGGARISRPPGTERLDAYGRPTNTPLWRNPTELGRYLVTQFPQGRAAVGAVEEPVLRYGQGSPVLVQGETIPTGTGRWNGVASLFGVPLPATIDTGAITERRQERRTAAAEARARYDENLRRALAGR